MWQLAHKCLPGQMVLVLKEKHSLPEEFQKNLGIISDSGKGERCHFLDSTSGFPVTVCVTDAMNRLMCKERLGTRKSYIKTHQLEVDMLC